MWKRRFSINRPPDGLVKELYGHLEDKTEEYKSEGLAEEEAMSNAVRRHGDAAALGSHDE